MFAIIGIVSLWSRGEEGRSIDYVTCLKRAIDHIEENLTKEIALSEVSRYAGFSLYHFHRIFSAIVGDSLKGYIRKRRLTEAAKALHRNDSRVLDIALKYQFESQESFTRAFKKWFGTTPGRYRRNGVHISIRYEPRLTEKRLLHLIGGLSMQPKIIVKQEFMVVGMECITTMQDNKEKATIPELWCKFVPRIGEVQHKANNRASYGICEQVSCNTENFSYIACVPVTSLNDIPNGMVPKVIPTAKYAVFTHKGNLDTLGDTYSYIYKTWLPKSGWELADTPDFELYDERFNESEESEMDIYVPIK